MTVTRRKLKERRPAKARPQAPPAPGGTALATTTDEHEAYLAFDAIDEQLLLQGVTAIAKNTPKPLVYSFPVGGKQTSGLSSIGVDVAVREMAKQGELLRIVDLEEHQGWKETPKSIYATVIATRFSVNLETGEELKLDSRLGVCIQPKFMKLREGGVRFDDFAVTKAMRKAQRNAFSQLLTPSIVAAILQTAKAAGNVVTANEARQSYGGQHNAAGRTAQPPARSPAAQPVRAATTQNTKSAQMEFSAQADAIEKRIGKENFTRVLGAYGYEKFQQVPNDPKVWAQLLHEWGAYEQPRPDFGTGGSGSTGKLF